MVDVSKDYAKHKLAFYRVFERFFGAKGRKVDPAILDGYWKSLKGYEIDKISEALDSIPPQKEAYFLPAASDIIDEIKRLRASRKSISTIVPHYCPRCNSTGLLIVAKIANGVAYDTAYRCECPNGLDKDARILPISAAGLDHTDRQEDPLINLPQATVATLRDVADDFVWEGGLEVSVICEDCKKPYSIRHERRVTGAEMKEFHITRTRPHQCELCFIEEGYRRKAWC